MLKMMMVRGMTLSTSRHSTRRPGPFLHLVYFLVTCIVGILAFTACIYTPYLRHTIDSFLLHPNLPSSSVLKRAILVLYSSLFIAICIFTVLIQPSIYPSSLCASTTSMYRLARSKFTRLAVQRSFNRTTNLS